MESWIIGVRHWQKFSAGFRILQPVMRIPALYYRAPGTRPLHPHPIPNRARSDHFPFKLYARILLVLVVVLRPRMTATQFAGCGRDL